jgi:hypothetical protein
MERFGVRSKLPWRLDGVAGRRPTTESRESCVRWHTTTLNEMVSIHTQVA